MLAECSVITRNAAFNAGSVPWIRGGGASLSHYSSCEHYFACSRPYTCMGLKAQHMKAACSFHQRCEFSCIPDLEGCKNIFLRCSATSSIQERRHHFLMPKASCEAERVTSLQRQYGKQ